MPAWHSAHRSIWRSRDNFAGFDLGFVFFGQPGPIHPRLGCRLAQDPPGLHDSVGTGQLAYSDSCCLLRGYACLHLAFRKIDHEKLQAGFRNCLNFDRRYLADAVSGVHDKFVFLEFKSVRRRLDLAPINLNREIDSRLTPPIRVIEPTMFKIHSAVNPFSVICDFVVAQSSIGRQPECFYVHDVDDTITPKSVASRQLVPSR